MESLEIVKHPADILTKKCSLVSNFDRNLRKFLKQMYETMVSADGVGLAAPQVNVSQQIALVDVGDDSGLIELINPIILEEKGEQFGPEGCLSFPGLFGEVKRSYYVKVRAQNLRGISYVIEAEDFLARAIQHEIDHLHGILFTEKIIRYYDAEELQDG